MAGTFITDSRYSRTRISPLRPNDREGEQMATSARLLHLIANHRDQAVAAMDKLSDDEREYWKHQTARLLVALDADGKHADSRRAALTLS